MNLNRILPKRNDEDQASLAEFLQSLEQLDPEAREWAIHVVFLMVYMSAWLDRLGLLPGVMRTAPIEWPIERPVFELN